MSERQYWLGFSLFPGIGPKKYSLLLERFETAKNAWEADHKLLQTVIGNVLASQFVTFRETYNPQIIVDTLEKKQISFVTLTDKEYPQLLKHISNPPFVLYVKGNLYNSSSSEALAKSRSKSSRQARTENTIAIVGTHGLDYGKVATGSPTLTSVFPNTGTQVDPARFKIEVQDSKNFGQSAITSRELLKLSLEEYVNEKWSYNKTATDAAIPNKKVSAIKETTLDGKPAYQFSVTGKYVDDTGSETLSAEYLFVFTEHNGYKIKIWFPKSSTTYNQIFNTIMLTK